MIEDRRRLIEEVRRNLMEKDILNKLEEVADNTDKDSKTKKKVSDPLAGMKAVVKHYGSHNRLI